MRTLRGDAENIICRVIRENLPEAAVEDALRGREFEGGITLLAVGKAAWNMAKAACDSLGKQIKRGTVITKYGHSRGAIADFEILEAGHPVPDENTLSATEKAVKMAQSLESRDTLLFLISGGGSSLFEKPADGVSLDDLTVLNESLLASGASITEINSIRKRLSAVKGGRFAEICAPAKVFAVILSDVIGDRPDIIASGPVSPDMTTSADAMAAAEKYGIHLTDNMRRLLLCETPKKTDNVEAVITGSVRTLCSSAACAARELGYEPHILDTSVCCEAAYAGKYLGHLASDIVSGRSVLDRPCAVIMGGETTVRVRGDGLGGRNQELALSAAIEIDGLSDVLIFSLGSDGTDGPTDAAGGIIDGDTASLIRAKGLSPEALLENNDSYRALKAADALIFTGPTGTNVNDLYMILCAPAKQ